MRDLGRLLLLLAMANPAIAINENAGTTGFNFLKVPVGARASALGGAFVAMRGDLESTTWNPAGLLGVRDRAGTLSLTRYLVDTEAGFACIAFPGEDQVWALSVNYFNHGDMRRTDAEGRDLGNFGASDLAVYLSRAREMWRGRLTVGINLKAIYSRIDDFSSDAYVVDVGMLASTPIAGMTFGAALSNLGTVRSAYTGGSKDSLPVKFSVGITHRPAHAPIPVVILADLHVPNDNDAYLAFGAEFRVGYGLYLRPGYSLQQTGLDGDDPLGVSAGAGFLMQGYRLDYAFTSFPDLGDVHRVSVSGAF